MAASECSQRRLTLGKAQVAISPKWQQKCRMLTTENFSLDACLDTWRQRKKDSSIFTMGKILITAWEQQVSCILCSNFSF
jgi:hypothetical protein